MKKYRNILACEENFRQMIEACEQTQDNVEQLKTLLGTVNSEHLGAISNFIFEETEEELAVSEDSVLVLDHHSLSSNFDIGLLLKDQNGEDKRYLETQLL